MSSSTPHPTPTTADQALLRAIEAWGETQAPALIDRLSSGIKARLAPDWEFLVERGFQPERAQTQLRNDARAQRRVDLSQIHPSWIERALHEESPAVRRLIAVRAEEPIAGIARSTLSGQAKLDHEPDGPSAELALALWAERLVGDQARRDDDPPLVIALATLRPVELLRLTERIGLVKLRSLPPERRPRLGSRALRLFETRISQDAGHAERVAALIQSDLSALDGPPRRIAVGLGLLTLGRLATTVEPYRFRWAIQHLPYSIAKRVRLTMAQPLARNASVVAWESRVFRLALRSLSASGNCPSSLRGFA